MATNNAVDVPLSGSTGTGNFVGATLPTFATNIQFNTSQGIADTSGNFILNFTKVVTAVNYVNIENNSTGNTPQISAVGSDTNVTLRLLGQGTGGILLTGTGTNDNAPSGYVGEFISSNIAFASGVSLTTTTAANVTSISLTAGDWDVWGNVFFTITGTCTIIAGWINNASVTGPDASLTTQVQAAVSIGSGTNNGYTVPGRRFSLASTTTIYLGAIATFSTGAVTVCGSIQARRRR
jgi:hypothetical protein